MLRMAVYFSLLTTACYVLRRESQFSNFKLSSLLVFWRMGLYLQKSLLSSECLINLPHKLVKVRYIDLVALIFINTCCKKHLDVEHKIHMDNVREYMRQNKLPPDVQDQVLAYKAIQYRRIQGMDEAHLFDDIPRSVQQKIQEQLYMDLVKTVPLFADMDDDRIRQAVCFSIKVWCIDV